MPIYEYACEDCSSAFELLVRGNERPQCPQCGGLHLTKEFSVPAAHTAGGRDLPICNTPAPAAGCGLPQCGMGGCMGMGGM